jgi:hypothetical protein
MAAQTMVVDPNDSNPDIGGWVADLRAEFSVSSFYLYIVLKIVNEKSNIIKINYRWDLLTLQVG